MSSNQVFNPEKKNKPYKYFKFYILEAGMRSKYREKKPNPTEKPICFVFEGWVA